MAGLVPGTVLGGDFRVVSPLSEGGMGAVFVAEQLPTGRRRALKLMHPRLVADARMQQRFVQEARVAAIIESDHVVEVISWVSTRPRGSCGSRWNSSRAKISPRTSAGAARYLRPRCRRSSPSCATASARRTRAARPQRPEAREHLPGDRAPRRRRISSQDLGLRHCQDDGRSDEARDAVDGDSALDGARAVGRRREHHPGDGRLVAGSPRVPHADRPVVLRLEISRIRLSSRSSARSSWSRSNRRARDVGFQRRARCHLGATRGSSAASSAIPRGAFGDAAHAFAALEPLLKEPATPSRAPTLLDDMVLEEIEPDEEPQVGGRRVHDRRRSARGGARGLSRPAIGSRWRRAGLRGIAATYAGL